MAFLRIRTKNSCGALSLVSALGLAGLFACTATNTQFVTASGDGGAPGDQSTLAEIGADKLGGKCSGYGTSIGDTALFPTDACPGGACLVDARTGLELYCSASCDNARCPTGWLCQDVSVGGPKRACFRDPNAPPDAGAPDAKPAVVDFRDARLPAYKGSSQTQTTVALRDFADPSGATRDLVIVLVDGAWSIYDNKQMADLDAAAALYRAELVSVLSEGTMAGTGATPADFTKWRAKYTHVDMSLDPELAQLGSGLGAITALPTWFVFSARTMKQIATEQGYLTPDVLASTVETWRTLAKK